MRHHPSPRFPQAGVGPTLRADFDDLEHLCATVRGWDLEFRPLAVRASRGKVAHIVQHAHAGIVSSYARFRVSIDQLGAPPADTLTFAVLGPGVRRLWWRGRDLDQATVMAFPVGGDLRSVSGSDFEVHTLSVPQMLVQRLAEQAGLPLPPTRRRAETFRPPARLLAALRRQLLCLHQLDSDGAATESVCIAETLVLAWLRAHSGEAARQPGGTARQRDRAVQACLSRLEHPDWMELSPAALCHVGGVAERTLQYAFRERFDLTPAAFLKARRLGAVRAALRRAEPEQSVADIAARFGFWHTGQFAADYRRAFGEAPSSALGRIDSRGS